MRLVFMGTPPFAVPSLEALLRAGHEVAAVYTQPDRPAGRGQEIQTSPVKRAALAASLPVRQPRSLRPAEEAAALAALKPPAIVVAAYGLLLPQAVLDIPPLGCLNVHPSLLPRYRGASPIIGTLLAGDSETGVTVMLLDAGMDTGPVLVQEREPVQPTDTAGSLGMRLAQLGARLLVQVLPRWAAGELSLTPQDNTLATYTQRLKKEDGDLDFREPAVLLERKIRAYQPWPGAYTWWRGQQIKVLEVQAVPAALGGAEPGLVVPTGEGPAVVTGEGALCLVHIQMEGGKPLAAEDFLRGHRELMGARLPER